MRPSSVPVPGRPYLTALFLLFLCLTALSAQAGTWSLTATGSGSASATRKPQRLLTIPTTASTGSLTIAGIGNFQSLTIGMTPATASGTATVTVTGT